jgi:hypothetical protein
VLPFEALEADEQHEVEQWAPALKQTINGKSWMIASQFFPVEPLTQ